MLLTIPVFTRDCNLNWSFLVLTEGVSFRSTSFILPFKAVELAQRGVESAPAFSMATLASAGKNSLANATATYEECYFLVHNKLPNSKVSCKYFGKVLMHGLDIPKV